MKIENTPVNNEATLIQRFYIAVEKYPKNVAVYFNGQTLSYSELNEKSNQLAHLLSSKGIGNGKLVAISLERSPEIIISILAILKCGAAYLPIDPFYPSERVAFMIDDSKAEFLITSNNFAYKGSNATEIIINQAIKEAETYPTINPSANYQPDDLAYILYTSGSTGKPKGAMVTQRNLVHFLNAMQEIFAVSQKDKLLSVSSISFDASCFDNYVSLTNGAELVLADNETIRDGSKLLNLIKTKQITISLATPASYKLMLQVDWQDKLPVTILSAGEPLAKNLAEDLLPRCTALYNIYGPTETTVTCILTRIFQDDDITIGKPIPGTPIYILDEQQRLVKENEVGEIYIGGHGVSLGYYNRPELTAEKFLIDPFNSNLGGKMYRSGDLGRWRMDGKIDYLGRIDHQVKIRGFRIELGEIENELLLQNNVKEAIVTAGENRVGEKRLIAYTTIKMQDEFSNSQLIKSWKEGLGKKLPEFMIPEHFIILDEFPLNPNGKIDRKALPEPSTKRPELQVLYRKPHSKTEIHIAEVWSQALMIDKIGLDDNFFELGGNSLLAQKVISEINKKINHQIPIAKLYQFPTIAGLQSFLNGHSKNKINNPAKRKRAGAIGDIAIIGMECNFPGTTTIEKFWEVLINGEETITFFKDEDIDPAIPSGIKNDPMYVKARGVLKDVDLFDTDFFGINPKLAELMDPQHKVFLETARNLLEKTGYLPELNDSVTGVFGGCNTNTYFNNNIVWHKDKIEIQGYFPVVSASDKDYVASRISYQLDLKGPAINVNSACSTSLLAVALAVESLRAGQCDIAIAGGVAINVPVNSGHLYEEGAMLSNDGHCRPFDALAKGTVFSDGSGAVLLKPLENAKKDGDIIYAVIKGVGINNDGGKKGSFTAPSSEGQYSAIDMALKDAGINPAQISYIETHGTATPLGDPIEIEGLRLAFGEQKMKQFCSLGSVKSNMGHLTHAAGVASLIKTSLALYHKKIPPTINYCKPNPAIDFQNSPFIVNDKLRDWDSKSSRFAGVSSFGVGGTNVHLILESYDSQISFINDEEKSSTPQLIAISARNEKSLVDYAKKLRKFLQNNSEANLNDIGYTLHKTRQNFAVRNIFVAKDLTDLISQLSDEERIISTAINLKEKTTNIVFMFPGQGSQYVNMGKELYLNEPVYKNSVDQCAEILLAEIGEDIREVIFNEEDSEQAAEKLKNTYYTQPAIFTTSYALAKLYLSWGLLPNAFVGHSIGEFVAAHLAGVFSLADALKIIAARAKLISDLPGGSMLSVRASKNEIIPILAEHVSIAANNAPNLCVVAGNDSAVEIFSKTLTNLGISNKLLRTSHAFHSEMMDPIINSLQQVIATVQLNIPKTPILSTVTSSWMKDQEACDPAYWARHSRATVNFSDAIKVIDAELQPIYFETGPGTTTTVLTKQHNSNISVRSISALDTSNKPVGEIAAVKKALGKLWQLGIDIDWSRIYKGEKRNILHSVPTYAYNKKRLWVSPPVNTPVTHNFNTPEEIYNKSSIKENPIVNTMTRKTILTNKIKEILESASGMDVLEANPHSNFTELGMDSLLLTQIASSLKKEFQVPITFRKLNEEYDSIDKLAEYLDVNLPASSYQQMDYNKQQPIPKLNTIEASSSNIQNNAVLELLAQQITLLSQQVAILQGENNAQPSTLVIPPAQVQNIFSETANRSKNDIDDLSAEDKAELKKPFGATAKIEKRATEITPEQKIFLNMLIKEYNQKTRNSKEYTQKYRPIMSDPRVVSGFKPITKEMIYSIVMNKSKGVYLWDIDGNEYIDALNGFGSNFFGYQADFLKDALIAQAEKGYEIGPQHELSGEVSELICELTGAERAALCNTGSEAVLGAMRIARTVTNKNIIVAFTGSYHGIVDEVLVRGTKKLKTFPAASGILSDNVQNMLILDYGTEESFQVIKAKASEIAAVLVEPVQSRRPEFQPIDYLRKLRDFTQQNDIALIFDEVITGFRCHPGGTQALFGIQADIATYGKVVGGGLSIGVIAGKKEYMDALDGGFWEYGNASIPEVGVTYFAGTFVRHPLALATALASLKFLKQQGPSLQENLNNKTEQFVKRLNDICEKYKIPVFVAHFSSLWKIKFKEEYHYQELLFTMMRLKNIHIWDGFPCFLTTAHTDIDLEKIGNVFEQCISELCKVGFIPQSFEADKPRPNQIKVLTNSTPLVPGAKIGMDEDGNPAWFIEDDKNPGQYLKVSI